MSSGQILFGASMSALSSHGHVIATAWRPNAWHQRQPDENKRRFATSKCDQRAMPRGTTTPPNITLCVGRPIRQTWQMGASAEGIGKRQGHECTAKVHAPWARCPLQTMHLEPNDEHLEPTKHDTRSSKHDTCPNARMHACTHARTPAHARHDAPCKTQHRHKYKLKHKHMHRNTKQ